MTISKALVVLSGGQDSTTCAALAVKQHGAENVAAITFDYGQRHRIELEAANNIANLLGIQVHFLVVLGSILRGTSPLTAHEQPLETYSDFESMDKVIGNRVEKTFVPMRNALFLTIAANHAAVIGASMIYTGVCQADNANYPDCRQVFIDSQEMAINDALGYLPGDPRYIKIATPLMNFSKAESIHLLHGMNKLPLLAFTHTAYDGTYPPISKDHASVLRAHGFEEAGLPDPLVVRAWMEGKMERPTTPNYNTIDPKLASEILVLKGKIVNAGA